VSAATRPRLPSKTSVAASLVTGLGADHRATLEKILRHPATGNIEWRQVRSLLEAVGATTEEHSGKLRVTLGGETEVFELPRGKDIDPAMIVDLRRMFTEAELDRR
jgi:hypothetical protein